MKNVRGISKLLNASHLWRASLAVILVASASACQDSTVAQDPVDRAMDASTAVCDDADLTCARGDAGNSCANAIVLPVGSGRVTGTTVNGQDHGTGSGTGCTNVQQGAPDRIYTFTLAKAAKVKFDMTGYDTVLHLRADCAQANTQVACSDDAVGSAAALNKNLEPGQYFLFADSYKTGGVYTLVYSMASDPCAENPCGSAQCVPSADWTSFECKCAEGDVPVNGACVDDPCDPNPCQVENQGKCVVDGAEQYTCECDPGFIFGDGNVCIPDPNLPEWTFMVYLNADNNLQQDGLDNLAQMQTAGSNAKVNLVVLMDTDTSNGGRARKLYVTKGGVTVIADLGEIDMGIPETLADFGTWAVRNYPAKQYFLDLWNHGSGWDKAMQPPVKGISSDDSSGNVISVAKGEYAAGLAPIAAAIGRPIDVVGFDACLMAMWEVANATAPYAKYLLASEETEPAAGWPYDKFLQPLVANPMTSPVEISTKIVDTYFAAGSRNSTMSLVDLSTMSEVNAKVTAFANELKSAVPTYKTQINNVRGATRAFYYSNNRDLYDFAVRLVAAAGLPATLKAAAQGLTAQLDVSILANKAQSNYAGAHGMAIYLPAAGTSFNAEYTGAGAIWSELTTWDEFLKGF